jgi:hypothetical protein
LDAYFQGKAKHKENGPMLKTFLQFVCEQEPKLGRPAKHGAPGDSYWCCPIHNDTRPSFHTLPHKPGQKDRWRCFGCPARGDEADLLAELHPEETWPARKRRLARLWEQYCREVPARNRLTFSPPFFFPGTSGRFSINTNQGEEMSERNDGTMSDADLTEMVRTWFRPHEIKGASYLLLCSEMWSEDPGRLLLICRELAEETWPELRAARELADRTLNSNGSAEVADFISNVMVDLAGN